MKKSRISKNQFASICLTASKYSYSDQDLVACIYIESLLSSKYNQLKLAFVGYRKFKIIKKDLPAEETQIVVLSLA